MPESTNYLSHSFIEFLSRARQSLRTIFFSRTLISPSFLVSMQVSHSLLISLKLPYQSSRNLIYYFSYCNSSLVLINSPLRAQIDLLQTFSLIFTSFLTILAQLAKQIVDKVSKRYQLCRLILAMKVVLEFPPREFFNKKVSLESLYLICFYFSDLGSESPLITDPSTDRDLLILHPSLNLSPQAPVYFCLSLPARSMKLNLEKQKFLTSPQL